MVFYGDVAVLQRPQLLAKMKTVVASSSVHSVKASIPDVMYLSKKGRKVLFYPFRRLHG